MTTTKRVGKLYLTDNVYEIEKSGGEIITIRPLERTSRGFTLSWEISYHQKEMDNATGTAK